MDTIKQNQTFTEINKHKRGLQLKLELTLLGQVPFDMFISEFTQEQITMIIPQIEEFDYMKIFGKYSLSDITTTKRYKKYIAFNNDLNKFHKIYDKTGVDMFLFLCKKLFIITSTCNEGLFYDGEYLGWKQTDTESSRSDASESRSSRSEGLCEPRPLVDASEKELIYKLINIMVFQGKYIPYNTDSTGVSGIMYLSAVKITSHRGGRFNFFYETKITAHSRLLNNIVADYKSLIMTWNTTEMGVFDLSHNNIGVGKTTRLGVHVASTIDKKLNKIIFGFLDGGVGQINDNGETLLSITLSNHLPSVSVKILTLDVDIPNGTQLSDMSLRDKDSRIEIENIPMYFENVLSNTTYHTRYNHIDPETQRTPLLIACFRNYQIVTKLLLTTVKTDTGYNTDKNIFKKLNLQTNREISDQSGKVAWTTKTPQFIFDPLINCKDKDGSNAFSWTAFYDNPCCDDFIDIHAYGIADIGYNVKDERSVTPFMYISQNNNARVLHRMLQFLDPKRTEINNFSYPQKLVERCTIDINAITLKGNTALLMSLGKRSYATSRMLLELKGINWEYVNNAGHTAYNVYTSNQVPRQQGKGFYNNERCYNEIRKWFQDTDPSDNKSI